MIAVALCLFSVSGLPGLLMRRAPRAGQRAATTLMTAGSAVGLITVGIFLATGRRAGIDLFLPAKLLPFSEIDALSAFFLVPVFLIGALGSLYGLGYWPAARKEGKARKVQVFWGTLIAGMALLVAAKHTLVFLLGWEAMALSAFFLVTAEDEIEETRKAGWLYFIATHVGTLALFGLFAFLRNATGSFAMAPIPESLPSGTLNILFLVLLLGFGMKAGIMPLHFWLPSAHANAPSHVSALMSGVVIKMGIYGIVRFLSLFPPPPIAWGGLILLLGMTSALLGVVFAIAQHDLKRLLAYHSVENIGIILMGLGLAVLGRATARPEWIVLGMAGCLLHVWNHGLFKALLFLGAGSVIHASETRQIDTLGGLAKKMPWTAALFLVGAVAICGLPPLNGFVSELFVYLGLLRTFAAGNDSAAVFGAPLLAMVGALAVACFVKVYGAVFSGTPRGPVAEKAHEAPFSMRLPMLVLAAACITIGVFPASFASVLDRAIAAWAPSLQPTVSIREMAPLHAMSVMSISLIALVLVLGLSLLLRARSRRGLTWDCGYAEPNARMQYTASSFAQTIVGLFAWVLKPREEPPRVVGAFPSPTALHSHVDDTVLDKWIMPTARSLGDRFAWVRKFQQGLIQHYLLYVFIIVVVLLGTLIPFKELIVPFFVR